MTRARAKRFKEGLNRLIQEAWNDMDSSSKAFELNSEFMNVIQVNMPSQEAKKRGNLEAGVAALCCRCRIPLSGIQALPHHPSVQDGRYRTVHAVQGRDFMRFYAILLDFLSCFKDFLDLFQF